MKKYLKFTGKNKFKLFGFIPARMAATRFPGKPLKKILGKPMIEHVFKRASLFKGWEKLYLTTCDKEIRNFSQSKNIPYIMTSKKHKRCLDRIYEAAFKKKKLIRNQDIIICVQGDEPMIKSEMITEALNPIINDSNILITNLLGKISNSSEFEDPNCIKVVCDLKYDALYFSREPIPTRSKSKTIPMGKQICIIPFRRDFLINFIPSIAIPSAIG